MKKKFSILHLTYKYLLVILNLLKALEWLVKLVGEVVNYSVKIIRA